MLTRDETRKFAALRPESVLAVLPGGEKSSLLLVGGHPVFKAMRDIPAIIMAANIRIPLVIPGIFKAAAEMDTVVAFELAKSEGDLSGGYTGQTPTQFAERILDYAEVLKFNHPFIIHGDHITVKNSSPDEIEDSRKLIRTELAAGYTSLAIDASFNPLADNIAITTDLAAEKEEPLIGLEVEVGEIVHAGAEHAITTVEEADEFISSLAEKGVSPDLLAINNGSKHGNYKPGEEVHIDLERTGEIAKVIRRFGVTIAQHGITGTPVHLLGQFADYGIRKGNVGTNWQNIAYKGLPPDLIKAMEKWAEDNGQEIKKATKVFKKEIDAVPDKNKKMIADLAYESAIEFFTAFRCQGLVHRVAENLL